MAELKHLLIRGVNWLGDAVMTLPAIQRLREAHPHARFSLLTDEKLEGLWQGNPVIDNVLTFKDKEPPRAIGRRLRHHNIDTALILPNSPRSALEAWHANIPCRVGYAAKWRRLLLTKAIPSRPGHVPMRKRTLTEIHKRNQNNTPPETHSPDAHHVHQYLHLAKELNADPTPVAPQVFIPQPEIETLKKEFHLPTDTTLLALIPGAEYGPAKRWPPENFAATAQAIQKNHHVHTLLLGGKGDREAANHIETQLDPKSTSNLAGRTSLRQLATALAACRCVLTNDTGPMHLAAAVDTHVIALFASTSPNHTAPGLHGNKKSTILHAPPPCAPCFLKNCPIDLPCQKNLKVETAITAIATLL